MMIWIFMAFFSFTSTILGVNDFSRSGKLKKNTLKKAKSSKKIVAFCFNQVCFNLVEPGFNLTVFHCLSTKIRSENMQFLKGRH